jgi:hypothetical protein
MAIRTVRLDDESEECLRQIREATGMPMSEAFKQGLRSLRRQVQESPPENAFTIYERLDLGPGGYSKTPSTDTKRGVAMAIRKKLRR